MRHILTDLGRPAVASLLAGLMMLTNGWRTSEAADHKVQDAGVVLQLHGSEFKFIPNELNVVKGQKVTIIFTNDGVLAHNFAIESLGLKTKTIQSNGTAKLSFTAKKAGSFKFRCLVPGHMEIGMKGNLVVTARAKSSGE